VKTLRRLVLWMLLSPALLVGFAAGQETRFFINQIEVQADSVTETIVLGFDHSPMIIPSLHFEKGLIRATLPHTDFDPVVAHQVINDRFLKNLRLERERTSAILQIVFSDLEFDGIGRITHRLDGKNLIFTIQKAGEPETMAEADLPSPVIGVPTAALGEYLVDHHLTRNIVKMLLALFLILLFFYLLLWVYNRFFLRRFRFKQGRYTIKISSSHHLNPKQKIMIIEVNDTAYACGVTPSQISVIAKVSDTSITDFLSRLDLSSPSSVSFATLRTQYLDSKKEKLTPELAQPADPANFASELIGRIKKLKPLD
jgi:flagellar biosynthetic protein FliO